MDIARGLPAFNRLWIKEWLSPTVSHAFLATVAFMVPGGLAAFGLLTPFQAVFASFAAFGIASMHIRGAYGLRITLFLGLCAVFSGAAWLGTLASGNLALAVLATGVIGLSGGFWRHVLGEYGFSVAGGSTLLFLFAIAGGPGAAHAHTAFLATLGGSLGGLLLHAVLWPFLAEHPLRRTVALSWTGVADLCQALPSVPAADAAARCERVKACEHNLRTALDQASLALRAARTRRTRPFLQALEGLNQAAALLAVQVVALNTVLDELKQHPDFEPLEGVVGSALAALVNTTRSVALAVVSHQPGHLSRFEVRLRRATHLLKVLQRRTASDWGHIPEGGQLAEVLRLVQEHLASVRTALTASMERAQERGPISYELFDLETWSLRPLASALNLGGEADPALVRFSMRIAVMMMAGTAAWRGLNLPHGYWIPLSVLVVLQPDYGATRARAVQRGLGTLWGSLIASLFLWVHPTAHALMAATALAIWAYTYCLRKHYSLAVFCITLLVVLQMEATGPVTLALTAQRLGFTLAGCVLAVVGAVVFWPVWERNRMPPLLAEALRANRVLLDTLLCRLEGQEAGGLKRVVEAKLQAQRANSLIFSSLNRMAGDPRIHREGLEEAAALANGNLRITRWLNAGSVHLQEELPALGLAPFREAACASLEALAEVVEGGDPAVLLQAQEALEAALLPVAGEPRAVWVLGQLAKTGTELSAMLLQRGAWA